jgi:hypothetical protein
MKAAAYNAPSPPADPAVLLVANNRKMLALAGSDADGTLNYSYREHTVEARSIVGEDKWVGAQAVLLETDPGKARAAARAYMKFYLTLPAYPKNLGTLGFSQSDLANGGSDRLVDTRLVIRATSAWQILAGPASLWSVRGN